MVEPFLNLLITEGMIKKEVGRNISIITILNYDRYQANNNTYLDADLNPDNSGGFAPYTQQSDAHLDTYVDAHLDAHLDAINKEYKNIKNISTTTTSACVREAKYIEELKNSQIWIEQMAMRFHVTIGEVVRRLDSFALDCDCRGTEHQNFNDTRRHFNDWLRIQLEAERKNNYAGDRQKTENRRRGADVTATTGQDYEGSF